MRVAVLVSALAALVPASGLGQGANHLLIVTGLSGEPQYAASFSKAAQAIYEAAKQRWGVRDSSVIYLAENPAADPSRISGRANREGIVAAFAALSRRVSSGDVVLIILIGHGSQQGTDSRLSLPGPDLSAAEFADLVKPLGDETVVFVNASSASGDFLPLLSGPHRIVITATKSAFERNATLFPEFLARGLGGGEADTDKDGWVSMLEAFNFARREVARVYQAAGRLQTEHAQLDDNGDRIGSTDIASNSADGALARVVSFAVATEMASSDPRVNRLQGERRQLETAIAELRQRKAAMDSVAYERELERLLVALAEKTQELRALEQPKQ